MADIIIPQGGATTPVTLPTQDLQINLDNAPKAEEITVPENTPVELDLDLDLNLPEAPKNDDRLKTEDQKNSEVIEAPVVETPVIEAPVTEVPAVESPVVEPVVEPAIVQPETWDLPTGQASLQPTTNEIATSEPVVEVKAEEIVTPIIEPIPEVIPEKVEPVIEPEVKEIVEQPIEAQPSSTIETIPSSSEIVWWNPPEASSLKEDIKMINELEGNTNAGWLAPEAVILPQPTPVEAPKTFDLDAMLGNPIASPAPTESPLVKGENERGFVAETTQPVMPMPPMVTATPTIIPAFTIPTTTTQVPVQAVTQVTIPKKNKGVKVMLFTLLFVALGFATFFILKTMYPIEFGNMFGGQTQMHASEVTTGTELTGTELTWTELTWTELTWTEIPSDQISGTADTGTHESAGDSAFWALNDLGTPTTELPKDNIGRLTDYVTQGEAFLTQGKTLGNNTMTKYGLYISKKAAAFLEKIANGEEISNLSGYFAQFDQYLMQLNDLAEQTTEQTVSPTPSTDGSQEIPTDTSTTPSN